MDEATGQLLSIRQVAERLGMTEDHLRELARTGKLPASKHGGRWLVEAAAADNVRLLHGAGPRRVRGRLAEGVALDDFTNRLTGRGMVVSPPRRRHRLNAAQAAEATAIDRQLHPGSSGGEPAQLPPGIKGRARAAQRKALDHLEQRIEKPHPPERSL
ncbi:MAG TPA: helix-turn-helix domain-containing protein [Chloroflexota bacterium]